LAGIFGKVPTEISFYGKFWKIPLNPRTPEHTPNADNIRVISTNSTNPVSAVQRLMRETHHSQSYKHHDFITFITATSILCCDEWSRIVPHSLLGSTATSTSERMRSSKHFRKEYERESERNSNQEARRHPFQFFTPFNFFPNPEIQIVIG